MKWTLYECVLATLAYADLFSYPLTKEEVVFWLIGKHGKKLPSRLPRVRSFAAFYGLGNIQEKVAHRRICEGAAWEKWHIARQAIRHLSWVPTIQLIGVSGGLSVGNADPEDDIDLFFIVTPGCLWSTRLAILFLLEIVGVRRRHVGEREEKNRICPNMLIVSSHLCIPQKEQDVYTAHEVLQMVPLFERNFTYRQFLQANIWVRKFLPNAYQMQNAKSKMKKEKNKQTKSIFLPWNLIKNCFLHFAFYFLHCVEFPARLFQLWYMKSHRTTEVVSDTVLRFHPHDHRDRVKKKFTKRLQQLNIPLDKEFFGELK